MLYQHRVVVVVAVVVAVVVVVVVVASVVAIRYRRATVFTKSKPFCVWRRRMVSIS